MLYNTIIRLLHILVVLLLFSSSVVFCKDTKYKNESGDIFIVTIKDTFSGQEDFLYYKLFNITNNSTIKECLLKKDNAKLINGYVSIIELGLKMYEENEYGLYKFKVIEERDTSETFIVLDQPAYSLNFIDIILPLLNIFDEKETHIKLFNDSPAIITKVPKFIIHEMIIKNEGREIIATDSKEYLCQKMVLTAQGFLMSRIMPKIYYWYDIETNDLIKTQVKDSYKIITE